MTNKQDIPDLDQLPARSGDANLRKVPDEGQKLSSPFQLY